MNLSEKVPIELDEVYFRVITPANQAQVFDKLKQQGQDQVLFGLTDKDYEVLAVDNAKILGLVQQLKGIIRSYKKYYESDSKPVTK